LVVQVAAAMRLPERRARRRQNVFRAIAALAMASAATHSATSLLPSSPWWERVTVTITGDGKPQSCRFESSLKPEAAQSCDVVGSEAAQATTSGAKGQYTRITFERRFRPGTQPEADSLQPGERLLGGQVMALGIDPRGEVKTCKVVSQSGEMRPQYGCAEATSERFEASAGTARPAAREGYLTVIVYGHSEHVV
jgi:hypothetical protein